MPTDSAATRNGRRVERSGEDGSRCRAGRSGLCEERGDPSDSEEWRGSTRTASGNTTDGAGEHCEETQSRNHWHAA